MYIFNNNLYYSNMIFKTCTHVGWFFWWCFCLQTFGIFFLKWAFPIVLWKKNKATVLKVQNNSDTPCEMNGKAASTMYRIHNNNLALMTSYVMKCVWWNRRSWSRRPWVFTTSQNSGSCSLIYWNVYDFFRRFQLCQHFFYLGFHTIVSLGLFLCVYVCNCWRKAVGFSNQVLFEFSD